MKRLILFVAIYIATLAALSYAIAHEAPSGWSYPLKCCSSRDCQPVSPEFVTITAEGYRFTIPPGYHIAAPNGGVWDVPFARAELSPDGEFHLCISIATLRHLCTFAPSMGS
jgi:hypothetical protein